MTPILRRAGATLLGVALLASAAACGTADASEEEKITLVVRDFGNFGYKKLLHEYEAAHPGLRIVEEVGEFQEHHQALRESLDGGKAAGDVVAVEEAFIVEFRNRPDDFHNLLDFGAGDVADDWLPWKWKQSMNADATYQIGLGTDVGGLAMCFRPDLFRQAGLPTDRDDVAKLWPTWEAYVAVGKRFAAAKLPAAWTDSASNTYNVVLGQQKVGYYDANDRYLGENSPGVKRAWEVASAVVAAKLSAKLTSFSTQWTAAMQGGRFATLACPAWMLGQIQQNAPAARGTWDVTAIPAGAGNWGGSFLTIPKSTKHAKEAYDLAKWLTGTEQQRRVFVETGNLPSHPALYDDPAVRDLRNDFFIGAPVGQLFTGAAERKQPQYLGLRSGLLREPFEHRLMEGDIGKLTLDEAWAAAVEDARQVASK
jgi:cellobiose transport system substrate-binding protein